MARDEGATANLEAFLASLQAVTVEDLPEDERECTICYLGFVDGAQNPAIRLWCGHKFCKACVETTVTSDDLESANLCPACRAVLWHRAPELTSEDEDEDENSDQDQDPDDAELDRFIGVYVDFLRHVFPCPALLTRHDPVGEEAQRLVPIDAWIEVVRGEMGFREQEPSDHLLTPFACEAIYFSTQDSNSWSDAATRTAMAVGACSHPGFPGMVNEAIEIGPANLRPDDRLFEQERQHPHDQKYWVCRWNEIQVSHLLSRLIGTRKTYWEACEIVYRGLVERVHAFHGAEHDRDDPRFHFSLYEHLAVLWPVVSGLVGRFFLRSMPLHRVLSPWREGLHRPNEAGVQMRTTTWHNHQAPDFDNDTHDLHGPYFAPFGDGREYWIDDPIRQANPMWLRHGLWKERPAWAPERLEQVFLTMAPVINQ